MTAECISRRQFLQATAATTAAALSCRAVAEDKQPWKLRYILASCMYGTTGLAEIIPEAHKTGAAEIDIWPRVHGNQREQIREMGNDAFARLLEEHEVKLGILTHYDLGPKQLAGEMEFAKEFRVKLIITGSGGPSGLKGSDLKQAVAKFVEEMKPHVAQAAEHGVTIGIENHSSSLVDSADSIRWFAELNQSKNLGVALAPYHLLDDSSHVAGLIADLGPHVVHFYAWQHGMGCHVKLPKEQELLQMPGRGTLDFTPVLTALKKINYQGWTEIFMHPVPRGVPILDTTAAVTDEINRARKYLEACAAGL